MKTHLLVIFLFANLALRAQITNPVIKAGFGVDAELRTNYFNGFLQSGNDDWFNNGASGTGRFVIDTTGAYAQVQRYLSSVASRRQSIYRTMNVPAFTTVNNRIWLDALWVRDYHGTDTTVFTAGSDKNGMSPANWTGGIQGIPDKNDILDMFMHVRRAGPNPTDSLWFFGGISLDNTTGNRYFDFEMYQTDIYYDRPSGRWYGFGPDAGHTSWQFDAAGNITRPGDIIFSAEYQNSTLTKIESRIWVDRSALSITPSSFNWSGLFDGASNGSQFGYASIMPKTAGAFYTGLGSGTNTWAGPFQLVLQDNSLVTNYSKDQFMEFSVNLTKLGLDPVTVFGTDVCGTPFNRLVVKTRASASFTAELKDFIAPTDLFLAPRVNAQAEVPIFCGAVGVSDIYVTNPSLTSVYTWTTPNGHIYGSNTGPMITVDAAGMYIVTQRLAANCAPYAVDTVYVNYDANCVPMSNHLTRFAGSLQASQSQLYWNTVAMSQVLYFDVERSADGRNFTTAGRVMGGQANGSYAFGEELPSLHSHFVFYRLKMKTSSNATVYSSIVRLALADAQSGAAIFPNPIGQTLQVSVPAGHAGSATIQVYDLSGSLVYRGVQPLNMGANLLRIDARTWKPGAYVVAVTHDGKTTTLKAAKLMNDE